MSDHSRFETNQTPESDRSVTLELHQDKDPHHRFSVEYLKGEEAAAVHSIEEWVAQGTLPREDADTLIDQGDDALKAKYKEIQAENNLKRESKSAETLEPEEV